MVIRKKKSRVTAAKHRTLTSSPVDFKMDLDTPLHQLAPMGSKAKFGHQLEPQNENEVDRPNEDFESLEEEICVDVESNREEENQSIKHSTSVVSVRFLFVSAVT